MVLEVRYPMLRIRQFGGLADTLMSDMIWDGNTGAYYLLDHNSEVVYRLDSANFRPKSKRWVCS